MKKQLLILFTIFLTTSNPMAASPAELCGLKTSTEDISNSDSANNTDVLELQKEAQVQIDCLKNACKKNLLAKIQEKILNEAENGSEKDANIITDQEINSCVQSIYIGFYEDDKKDRLKRINELKKGLKTTEELTLLINLMQIEDIALIEIKDIILENVSLWDDAIVYQIYTASIYDEAKFMEYLKTIDIKLLNTTFTLSALLEQGAEKSVHNYIVQKNELTDALLNLNATPELVEVVLNNTNSKLFSNIYLKYAKALILKDNNVKVRFTEILLDNIDNIKFNKLFTEVFSKSYNNEFWKFYLLASERITESHFENIKIKQRVNDIEFIIAVLKERCLKKTTTFLHLLLSKDHELFNKEINKLLIDNYSNKKNNELLLEYIIPNQEKIYNETLLNFIQNAIIDYDNEINVYYINLLAQRIMTQPDYYNYITNLYKENGNISFLVYAAYQLDTQKLKELIKLTRSNKINLLTSINTSLIRNIDSWVALTEECVKINCSDLNDLLNIPNAKIYNAVFKYGQVPQAINLVSRMANESNYISFGIKDMNDFKDTLNNRTPNFNFIKKSLENLIYKSIINVNKLLEDEITDTISRDNLNKRINDLIRGLRLINGDIDKDKVTRAILDIENVISHMKVSEQGIVSKELYNLVKLEKMAITKGFTNKVTKKSILSGLTNLFDKSYNSQWAKELILDRIATFGNLVMDLEDENQALYNAYIIKYALSTTAESTLLKLSYDEIDTLSKMMNYYNEMPKKIHLQTTDLNYSEIQKEFLISFNGYFNTFQNTQVNIPIICETGNKCTYDMKYDENIGALTTIKTKLQQVNFNNEGLTVYKNRNLNIIGALDDVLFIDGSVDKDKKPAPRKINSDGKIKRAANGIVPKIDRRNRRVKYCVLRVKLLIGNACLKEKTVTLYDEYVGVEGKSPEDGLNGFDGANSANIQLSLYKINKSRFARIIILNNTGRGGEGQPGGIWEKALYRNGTHKRRSKEYDITIAGVGFGLGTPGKGKRVSISEAIPNFKERGKDGNKGRSGKFGEVVFSSKETKSFSLLKIGKQPYKNNTP